MIVVDASIIADLLLGLGPTAGIRERLFRRGERMHAPHLIDLEVLETLRKYRRDIGDERLGIAMEALFHVPIERHAHEPLLRRIWELRDNFRAYDASYVALAELLNAPLVTRDGRLARSAGHAASIELIA
jgi:predicted nucleic acid-binding protein